MISDSSGAEGAKCWWFALRAVDSEVGESGRVLSGYDDADALALDDDVP